MVDGRSSAYELSGGKQTLFNEHPNQRNATKSLLSENTTAIIGHL